MTSHVITHQELGRAILCVLGRLFLPNLAQVPDVQSPVRSARGQDGLIVGGPLDLMTSS